MKKLFLLLCVWATLPAVAQTSKDKTLIIDASYLKQPQFLKRIDCLLVIAKVQKEKTFSFILL